VRATTVACFAASYQVRPLGARSSGAVLQPVVASERLRNLPDNAIFNWEPGAQFGIYRPDTFWFAGGAK
jgi:hypothetical protein